MTNLEQLKKRILESGMSFGKLAEITMISEQRLLELLAGEDEFKASEMLSLSRVLRLTGEESERIFFTSEVEYNETYPETGITKGKRFDCDDGWGDFCPGFEMNDIPGGKVRQIHGAAVDLNK